MGLFRKKSREMADAARDAVPGMEPKRRDDDVGIAGYQSIRYDKKIKHPQNRFNYKRPDGKPALKPGEEGRRRGFFS